MFESLYRKLFLSPYYFTIGIRRKTETDILSDQNFTPDYVMPATQYNWAADPMPVEYNGKVYLFYEAVTNDHGRIEVAEINDDCSLGKSTVLLSDECHYSYPFIFQMAEKWYMIPESSQWNEVRLYEAEDFPFRWHMKQILLREQAVDTTVYNRNEELYLLTFQNNHESESVIPEAYKMVSEGTEFVLSKIDWPSYDSLKVRGAGPAFISKGELYRPVQISEWNRYGNAVAFCRMNDENSTHSEEQLVMMGSEKIHTAGIWHDGLHTYSATEHYEVIDIRCREFDLMKLPKMLLNRLKK